MEVILPFDVHNNDEKLINCALEVNYDEYSALKLVFTNNKSDLDVFELIGDERVQQLLYGWEICNMQIINGGSEMSPNLQYLIKFLAYLSLKVWFGQEWNNCSKNLRELLIIYLDQARYVFGKIETLSKLNWNYLIAFNQHPWRVPYLQQIFRNLKQNIQFSIEHVVDPASSEDLQYLEVEGTHIILLRLIKLFDSGSWEAVKQLSLRVLSAWTQRTSSAQTELGTDEKQCIVLIGNLYLMAVFISDDNRGYNIDNMVHNIRFYVQSMQDNSTRVKPNEFTPARLIAYACILLGFGKNQFFEDFIFHAHDQCLTTLFGVVSQTYISYLLGNLLMELNAMNEQDFKSNFEQFKLFINRYVEEREASEKFLLNELKKQTAQKNSHAVPNVLRMNLNHKSLICKGNRASNISNENKESKTIKPEMAVCTDDEECDRQIDPIFQTIPDNEQVLKYVYDILAKRSYNGWQFAKIVLLLKIIGHKLNMIETWRYHPGLTIDFMISLEQKLSEHYADLAKIFQDFPFMEQEFWLTAFYLHPNRVYYNEVKRCGVRANRRRQNIDEEWQGNGTAAFQASRSEKATDSTKFGLLSSTINVKEIVRMTNHEAPNLDYEPIRKSLMSLRLPDEVLKDLLTVVFLPRNRSFSWALDWGDLRARCKEILDTLTPKRRFVELNMAEANDRLKYLKIDYEKYRHRPQLDYGTIEEGYENMPDVSDGNSNNEDDEDEDAFDCSPKKEKNIDTKKRRVRKRKFWDEESVSEDSDKESNDSGEVYTGSRRTRARTAAVIATAMFKEIDNSKRCDKAQGKILQKTYQNEANPNKSEPEEEKNVEKRSFRELLQSGKKQCNSTLGFIGYADIWNIAPKELSNVINDECSLMQWSTVSKSIQNIKDLKQKLSLVISDKVDNTKGKEESTTAEELSKEDAVPKLSFTECHTESQEDDNESLHSDTSTMAHQDSSETTEAHDFDDDDGFSNGPGNDTPTPNANVIEKVVIAESMITHHIPTARLSKDEDKLESKKTTDKIEIETKNKSKADKIGTKQSIEILAARTISDPEQALNARLIKECLTRRLEVRLCRLKAEEISHLREPRIRVKRLRIENYYENITRRSKRSRLASSCYYYGADDSGSTSTQTTDEPPKRQRRKRNVKRHTTSESSTDAEEIMLRKKHTKQRCQARKLVVTPRSESGLKLRISAREQASRTNTDSPDVIECIQLSSSTTSSSSPLLEEPSYRVPGSISFENTQDPLYEEEVVPFR